MTSALKAFAVILLAAGPALAAAAPADPAVRKVAEMVDFIKNNKPGAARKGRKEKTFSFSEAEVNSYLKYWIQSELENGRRKEVIVKTAEVHFMPGRVVQADAVAQVGMSSLKQLDGAGDSYFLEKLKQYLAMDNSMRLQCVLGAAKGKGFFVVQDVRIKGLSVPNSLVQQILQLVGKKQRPPRDFTRPMDLPNGIQKIEVLPQAIKLTVAPA